MIFYNSPRSAADNFVKNQINEIDTSRHEHDIGNTADLRDISCTGN